MDFISTGTEILKQENVLTPRQKDIIDTEKEMLKSPFDRNTAIGQVEKNCMSYPELALGVTCLLYTSPSPRDPKTSRMPSSA